MESNKESYGRELISTDKNGRSVAGSWYERLREHDSIAENGVIVGYSDDPLDGIRPVRVPMEALYENVAIVGDGCRQSGMVSCVAQQLSSHSGGMLFTGTRRQTVRFLKSIPESRMSDVVWIGPEMTHFNMFEAFDTDSVDPQFDSGVLRQVLVSVLSQFGDMGSVMSRVVGNISDGVYEHGNPSLDMVIRELMRGDTSLSIDLNDRDKQSFDPVLRRLTALRESQIANTITNPNGESLIDAVRDDAIIVCPVTSPVNPYQENDLSVFMTAVLQTVWRAMRVHNGYHDTDTPFSVVIANQRVVDAASKSVEKWLQEDFNSRVSCVTQVPQPMELHTKTRASLFVQSRTKFSFSVSDSTTANTISGELGDVGRNTLMRLNNDEWVGVILNRYGELVEMSGTAFRPPRVDTDRNVFVDLPTTDQYETT